MSEAELCATLEQAIKRIKELELRLVFAREDAKTFKAWAIEQKLDLYRPTEIADYAWSHIENILVATDLDDHNFTSLTWTNY